MSPMVLSAEEKYIMIYPHDNIGHNNNPECGNVTGKIGIGFSIESNILWASTKSPDVLTKGRKNKPN